MRKATNLLIAAVALSALALASPAFAAHFWTDTFPYANGNLTAVSGGNWVWHNGTGTDITVASNMAVVNMATGVNDDNRAVPLRELTDKTCYCLRFMLPDPAGTPTTGYFAHFKDAGTFNFTGRLHVMAKAPSYTLAILTGSGTPTVTEQWPSALAYGQWYTVIVCYDANIGRAEMWVDPIDENSPKVVHTDATKKYTVQGMALRQFTGNWIGYVDDIGVGTSFLEACHEIVPSLPTTWGKVKSIYR